MAEPTADRSRFWRIAVPLLAIGLSILWVIFGPVTAAPNKKMAYSDLLSAIEEGKIQQAEIRPEEIIVVLKDPKDPNQAKAVVQRIPHMDERGLLEVFQQNRVEVIGYTEKNSWWSPLLWTILPLVAFSALLISSNRNDPTGLRGRPMTFGQSKAKLYDKRHENPVTFEDVEGVNEAKAELTEVVRFLKEPDRYRAIGARVPKGVLLVGAPGTGKTLLARAVAGESGVPFFSLSGSEFVEMFVGVGASRVRDLFEQAKERCPCIIFIDELDAIGKARSGPTGMAANEEREQTLNQLLVEMDGFDSASGLVIMAATNRPEILDRALLRAGRFDRQVLVDRPDVRGREAILKVHVRKIRVGADVETLVIAQRTPGMVGADLANVVNEAALASIRRNADKVENQDFEEAIDRIQLGLKKEGRVMRADEKRRVAFHESGHALVALLMKHADPVHRVTVIPRSIGALGATLQLPTDERYLMTREELLDRICVLLGGRVAEEIACHDISTGAQDDLERATELARMMVCRFGMSHELGPMTFGKNQSALFLALTSDLAEAKNYSEKTAQQIDEEVRSIITTEYTRAHQQLEKNQILLDTIATELLTHETLQRPDLEALIGKFRLMASQHPAVLSEPSLFLPPFTHCAHSAHDCTTCSHAPMKKKSHLPKLAP